MKKIFSLLAVVLASASTAFAGGLITNTNQNAAYVRQMSQNGIIDITGIYANPAGTAFLSDGWHLSLNSQSAFQHRNITTTFTPMAYNVARLGNPSYEFKGHATAPVIPSVSVSYNHDKWSVNAHFSLIGGGGKCHFDNGLGTFEGAYSAMLPQVFGGMAPQGVTYGGYMMDSHLNGTSYQFGLSVGGTYKVLDNLAFFGGLRFVYATASYDGLVNPTVMAKAGEKVVPMPMGEYGIALDCSQKAFGVTPILGVNWKVNKYLNLAAKYEFRTRISMKNSTEMGNAVGGPLSPIVSAAAGTILGKFADGSTVRDDIPGILALGAQCTPIKQLRFMGGFNYYFDKGAKKTGLVGGALVNMYGHGIDNNTWEINLGGEWDINKWLTFSLSWQRVEYGISNEGMSDLSFNLSNNMIGGGFRINCSKVVNIDLGYMYTFYNDRDVVTTNHLGSGMDKLDHYVRKNQVFGIGVNLNL